MAIMLAKTYAAFKAAAEELTADGDRLTSIALMTLHTDWRSWWRRWLRQHISRPVVCVSGDN